MIAKPLGGGGFLPTPRRQHVHVLSNGLTLVAEEMDNVRSVAFSVLVPSGASTDPEGLDGQSAILADMLSKGTKHKDAHALSDAFEEIGVQKSHSAGLEVSAFSGVMLSESLKPALPLFREMLLEPALPESELESVKQLALQDLYSIEDDPASKVMIELVKRFYPAPFNRSQLGSIEGVTAVTLDTLKSAYKDRYVAGSSVIAVAGQFNWEDLVLDIEREFGAWGGVTPVPECGAFGETAASYHIEKDTQQLQIALAFPSVALGDPDYYAAHLAVGVLSGGMCGRLFVEVREKRGLVYRVSASHSAAKGRGSIMAYAGTTPERGQETYEVLLSEIRKLKDGIDDEELLRAKADLKSRLVMRGEMSASRAGSLSNDWWNLGLLRGLDEIKDQIERVTARDIFSYLEKHPVDPVTVVTLGIQSLRIPIANENYLFSGG